MLMFLLLFLSCFLAEIIFQKIWISKMNHLKIKQQVKLYGPSWHEKTKLGTPTMGGLVFIPIFLISIACLYFIKAIEPNNITYKIAIYTVLSASVGFIDDWIKYVKHSSDGLRSIQKLILQITVTLPWVIWVLPDGLELLPGRVLPTIPSVLLVTFVGVGFQNAVNVTDGLDGLATGCMLLSLAGAIGFFGNDPVLLWILITTFGILLGFLWQNFNPAEVFMGDVGSHFLAGLLFSLSLCSGVFIVIIPFGFLFGTEILSVAIQIISIRCFNKKIFLMSPIHHHFELLGWKETQIVIRFWIIHIIGMLACFFALDYLISLL
ncbi:MAG: phospho-N-acetylmuramoyl-pentapeptide-transferase [Synergistaceae bacterium]|jgi:phospho-N-acetylmuramoyl-pentapeptide-transferase|nr:phospho-N-acetylmuramoyl-pentapeptide-transferase [Synergistaceae bacterium]